MADSTMENNVYFEILTHKLSSENTSSHKCVKCKSVNLKFKEVQLRSSDEPGHLFISCRDCGHVSVDAT